MESVFAGVDLGGTNITAALALSDGRLLCERSIPTQSHEGPAAVLQRIALLVQKMVAQAGVQP